MKKVTFYDNTPFKHGYSSNQDVIANMNSNLKREIKNAKGKVICDIGCGCGRNLVFSSKYASILIGIDLSQRSLVFANQFVRSANLSLLEGDNLNIPSKDDTSDLVISDGVIHHTGNTIKAFSECVRILKPNGILYLAVYKKWRYYPILYKTIGRFFRVIIKTKLGNTLIENIFVRAHFLMYKIFKKQNLTLLETRNIFFDYFLTPIATFQSKKKVAQWIKQSKCILKKYDRTKGNCHVFIIQKVK